jgi:hypothetical protein
MPQWYTSFSAVKPSGEVVQQQDCAAVRTKAAEVEAEWNSPVASVWRGRPLMLRNTSVSTVANPDYAITAGFPLRVTYAQWCSMTAEQQRADRRGYEASVWDRIIEVINRRCSEIRSDLNESRRQLASCQTPTERCDSVRREWTGQISASWRNQGFSPPQAAGSTSLSVAVNSGDTGAAGFPLSATYQQWCTLMSDSQKRAAISGAAGIAFSRHVDSYPQEDWIRAFTQQIDERCRQMRSDIASANCCNFAVREAAPEEQDTKAAKLLQNMQMTCDGWLNTRWPDQVAMMLRGLSSPDYESICGQDSVSVRRQAEYYAHMITNHCTKMRVQALRPPPGNVFVKQPTLAQAVPWTVEERAMQPLSFPVPRSSSLMMAKNPSGEVMTSVVTAWIGGAAVGGLVTYLIARSR